MFPSSPGAIGQLAAAEAARMAENRNAKDMSTTREVARQLYLAMPGAERPPRDERGLLWGEVEHLPEWTFCESIARLHVRLLTRIELLEAAIKDRD